MQIQISRIGTNSKFLADLATEMLVLMAANGLGDFLHAQHVPSLSDCFSDRRTFAKFLQCSSDKETVRMFGKKIAAIFFLTFCFFVRFCL